MTILVTGGAGFIGANFVIDWLQQHDEPVVNLDKLTYAGNLASLQGDDRHIFIQGDICDQMLISQLLADHRTRAVINFAAEVYGSLEPNAPALAESHQYEPNSPYSASKASSDHLVRAYYHTYGLPVLTTNCSNNYGL
jgi:dTDP-glucose 4,6-dehydratase